MNSIIELFFSMIPVLVIGILIFILSLKQKKKYEEKIKKATKATVASVRVEESRNREGFLIRNNYVLGLAFLYEGTYIVKEYSSIYEYEVDSIIDVEVKDGNIKSILSNPPGDVMDNLRSLNLKWHQILFYISMFLFIFVGVGFVLNLVDYLGEEYEFLECIVLIIFILSGYIFLNKTKDKYQRKYKLIKSGGYSAIMGKIVDIKKTIRYKDHRKYEHYYPIIEYQEGYDIKKKVIYNNMSKDYNKLGDNFLIYKDRISGEILSENDVKFLDLKVKIIKGINILLLISIVLCVISYL